MRYSEFQNKEVINIANGKCLGYVNDIEFEEKTGCILSLIIPGPGRICGIFGRDTSFCIDFHNIVRIGPDIILVNVCELHSDRK